MFCICSGPDSTHALHFYGKAALSGFAAKVLEFTAGNGEVCDALEAAVCEMKKGEKAVFMALN